MRGSGDNEVAPGLLREVRLSADRVIGRLRKYGFYEPGRCMVAAMIGVCELRRVGLPAYFQAGACFWRRSTEPADAASAVFGYAYNPDDPISLHGMLMGGMPEFHAWVAVIPPEAKYEQLEDGRKGYDGFLVDYVAHLLPVQSNEAGMTWKTPSICSPAVVACGRSQEGGDSYYEPSAEACKVVSLVARSAACQLIRRGFTCAGDLFEHMGGPAQPPAKAPGLIDYSEMCGTGCMALSAIREVEERQTGRKHAMGSTRAGVW